MLASVHSDEEEDQLDLDLGGVYLGQDDELDNLDHDHDELGLSDSDTDEFGSEKSEPISKKDIDDEEETEELDDDENKEKPQFIPRRGIFYEHDNRIDDNDANATSSGDTSTLEKKKGKAEKKGIDGKWKHDKFFELEEKMLTLQESSRSEKLGKPSHLDNLGKNLGKSEKLGNLGKRWKRKSLKSETVFERSNSRSKVGAIVLEKNYERGPGVGEDNQYDLGESLETRRGGELKRDKSKRGAGQGQGQCHGQGDGQGKGWSKRGVGQVGKRWKSNKDYSSIGEGGRGLAGGDGEGVGGGGGRVKEGLKPGEQGSIPSAQRLSMRYSSQRQEKPKKLPREFQSRGQNETGPGNTVSPHKDAPLTRISPPSELNINAPVFQARNLQTQVSESIPMQSPQVPFQPYLLLPESPRFATSSPHPKTWPTGGFETQSVHSQLVAAPPLATIPGFPDAGQNIPGYPGAGQNRFKLSNKKDVFTDSNTMHGAELMNEKVYYDMTNGAEFLYPMITPRAS